VLIFNAAPPFPPFPEGGFGCSVQHIGTERERERERDRENESIETAVFFFLATAVFFFLSKIVSSIATQRERERERERDLLGTPERETQRVRSAHPLLFPSSAPDYLSSTPFVFSADSAHPFFFSFFSPLFLFSTRLLVIGP